MAELSHRQQTGHVVIFIPRLAAGMLAIAFLWAMATGFGDGDGDGDHSVPAPTIYVSG